MSKLNLLSVVIPARNEETCVAQTVEHLHSVLKGEGIAHEIIVVDDASTDGTRDVLQKLEIPELCVIANSGANGFGRAVIAGLNAMRGDAVVVMMADNSDSAEDIVCYWRKLNEGWDCVFGSRFMKGGRAEDYPLPKLILNRLANWAIAVLFGIRFNDTTNAFKAYRKSVIDGCRPLIAPHFNLTVEIPLKAMIRGFSWTVVPIQWRNRRTGMAKFQIREMGSRYVFICLYLWLEKFFSRGDYRRIDPGSC